MAPLTFTIIIKTCFLHISETNKAIDLKFGTKALDSQGTILLIFLAPKWDTKYSSKTYFVHISVAKSFLYASKLLPLYFLYMYQRADMSFGRDLDNCFTMSMALVRETDCLFNRKYGGSLF